MSIADRYREFIANRILREYLVRQVNPTIAQLEGDLILVDEIFPDMSQPFSSFGDFDVEAREPSSASKFNSMQDALHDDLEVLYAHVAEQLQESVDFLNRNLSEVSMLKTELQTLEDQLDEILLANKDSEGYFQFFMDSFNSMRFVDFTNTTAAIDLEAGAVTMKEGLTSRVKHNLNFLQSTDVAFQVLTRRTPQGHLESPSQISDADSLKDITKAFRDGENGWTTTVITSDPMTVSVELTVNIGDNKDVTKIEFANFQDDAYSAVNVQVQYSIDNINWFDWPGTPFVQNIRNKGIFTAVATRMQWVRFILTRSGYDRTQDGKFHMYFGARRISLFGLDYDDTGSRFQSKPLAPEERDGQQGFINRVSIESCEDTPEQTDILWYVSFDDGEQFIPITPVQRTIPRFAKVVSLNKIQNEFNGPFGFTIPTEQVNQEDVAIDFDVTTLDPFSTTVWRNVGEQGNVDTVRGVQRGWQFDDEFYSCYVWVDSFQGHVIDLGNTEAELDGAIITGRVVIPFGRHFFRTRQSNWVSLGALTEIDADVTDDGVVSDTVVGLVTDPLYPYNHKYLIEGLPYEEDLAGKDERSRIYLGADRYAGERPAVISAFDLTANARPDDYTLVAKEGSRFILKHDPAAEDKANEVFEIQDFFSSAPDLPPVVIVRADLITEQPGVTPVLYDYKVKFDGFYETT